MPPNSYDNEEIAKVVVAKTAPYFSPPCPADIAAIDLPNALACLCISEAARGTGAQIRVLDFGGAAGLHYLRVKHAIGDASLLWAVVETPSMVREATTLQRDDLRFFVSIASAMEWLGSVDVALSIGSLNYAPDPKHTMLEIMGCAPSIWVVGRQVMSFEQRVTLWQGSMLSDNGPGPLPDNFTDRGIVYRNTFMNHDEFIEITTPLYTSFICTNGIEVGKKNECAFLEFNFVFKRMNS